MEKRISLNGQWNFHEAGKEELWKGNVPGTVLTDLTAQKLAEDPFWRTNEYEARELFAKDYVYEREFDVPEDFLEEKEQTLVFEGLDTVADVILNEEKLLSACDMHRTWKIDVSGRLKSRNRLKVYFHSPNAYIQKAYEKGDIFYTATGSMCGNGYLRKAHYMFGWDWGPQLPDAGIFREVFLQGRSKGELEDVRIRQFHKEGTVTLEIQGTVRRIDSDGELGGTAAWEMNRETGRTAARKTDGNAEDRETLVCSVTGPDGRAVQAKTELKDGGRVTETVRLQIEDPQLWWPNGYGSQPLYRIRVSLEEADGSAIDCWERMIGLRTVTICTDRDQWGNQFAFVVNGQKIFAMGADYIPEDNLLGNLSEERSDRLIRDCARANFNCIRIWGGGYYPEDYVYDACDRYGILVWQDLMFACNVYDLNDEFEKQILAETEDNVRRIRHHACLGLWCGNNEMEWGWCEWEKLLKHRPKYKADYIRIFEMLLPRLVQKLDDQTFYWLSSPSSGGSFDCPNDDSRGDSHYWEVWHSNKPFTEYRNHYFRFCSEFGFQSFPGKKTLDAFSLPEDQNIFSEVMESHQKNGQANSKIFSYISEYYKYPKDMESIAYISQILQLKAMQYGVEHWRRNRGRCMGAIYWQLNDCWPVASWSSIDYYGRWKALHYGARRFYSRFMVSACEKEELSTEIEYFIHNESMRRRQGKLKVRLFDVHLHTLFEEELETDAAPFETKSVLSVDFADHIPEGMTRKQIGAEYCLTEDGMVISRGTNLFVKPKYFDFPKADYKCTVTEREDAFWIHIDTDAYAGYVELSLTDHDIIFEDNYFDITAETGMDVELKKTEFSVPMTAQELSAELRIRSVADSYRP